MRKANGWINTGVVLLLCGVCAGSLRGQRRSRYQAGEVKDGGTIIGVVNFEGDVPKPKTLKVTTKDDVCHQKLILSESLVVSDANKIKWAVASIRKIARGRPFPEGPMEGNVRMDGLSNEVGTGASKVTQIDQKGCCFIPHVVLIPERRPLKILNSDGILHTVHAYARLNPSMDKAMPPEVKQIEVRFRRRERVRLGCDLHAWTLGWIIVAEHPYYAVTVDDGTFRLEKVPVGTHTIEVWHEQLGTQTMEVTVKAGEEARMEFTFKG